MAMVKKDLMLRLIKYKRILLQLQSLGLEKVFSNNLGDAVGVSAALVRKDLSAIQLQGNRRGGYRIDEMITRLNELLGSEDSQEAVVIGVGNLGRALMRHENFYKEGLRIAAGFDLNPREAEVGGMPVYPMEVLPAFISEHDIRVAILCVPGNAAATARDEAIEAGVKGILNFAPIELKSTAECVINNMNSSLEVENLFFLVNSRDAGLDDDGTPVRDAEAGEAVL